MKILLTGTIGGRTKGFSPVGAVPSPRSTRINYRIGPRAGLLQLRNPILVSYVAKGLLPYRGLGSGIKRALEAWPDIAFTDDREGCLFTATVRRKEGLGHVEAVTAIDNKAYEGVNGGVNGGVNVLLVHVHDHPGQRSSQIASALGLSPRTIERWIKQLRDAGQIEFRGAPKTGGYYLCG